MTQRHRCGGSLSAREVQVVIAESAGFSFAFRVPGLVCDKCGEQLIERDTAMKLQASQTPTVVWDTGSLTTTRLDAIPGAAPLTAASRAVLEAVA